MATSNISVSTDKATKTAGRWLALIVAVLAVVTCIFYYVYESGLSAVDSTVILLLVCVAVLNVVYFLVHMSYRLDVLGIIEIVSTLLSGLALTNYLNSDISNLADLLNGVTIFSGGTGDVTSIFTLIVLMAVIGLLQVVICFMRTDKK